MASTDNFKGDSWFFYMTLIDQDSLRMTYFCGRLQEAGQSLSQAGRTSVPPAVMDHPAAQASLFYGCQSSGSLVPKLFGSWPSSWSRSGQEPAIKLERFVFYLQRRRSISCCWVLRGKRCSKARTILDIAFKLKAFDLNSNVIRQLMTQYWLEIVSNSFECYVSFPECGHFRFFSQQIPLFANWLL